MEARRDSCARTHMRDKGYGRDKGSRSSGTCGALSDLGLFANEDGLVGSEHVRDLTGSH